MSKLDELIKECCPDGVEYKTLEDIAIDIYRGSGIKRDQVTEEGIQCVRYGEIYTTYGIWFDKCVSHTIIENVASPKYFEHGDVLFAITGESVEDIAKSIVYVGDEKCLAGGDMVVLKHKQNPKYLAYALATTNARKQKSAGKVKSKVVHSSVPAIKKITIPVPALEVQSEIARILDNFTELTAELTAELTLRKLQYDYYKENLLAFENVSDWIQLNEVMEFRNGKGHEKAIASEGSYIVVNSKFISTDGKVKKYSNEQISPLYNDDILMVMSDLPNGRALAKTFLVDSDDRYTLNQRICALSVKDKSKFDTLFMYYFLSRNPQMLKYDNGVDQTNLKKSEILEMRIPVISLDKQKYIADILTRFDILCKDVSTGLPAEIDARQKQYEYYRDKLLTFKEIS